jgi:hypothetical protein
VDVRVDPAGHHGLPAEVDVHRGRLGVDGHDPALIDHNACVPDGTASTVEKEAGRNYGPAALCCRELQPKPRQRQGKTQQRETEPSNSCIFHPPPASKRL